MKKFIKYLAGILVLSALIVTGCFVSIVKFPANVFYSSYQSVIQDKFRALKETNDPKIVMISGSSSAFGLNQYLLEKETGYKVVNLGLHAGFGDEFETELAKANINKGDIVLLGYEYGWSNPGAFSSIGSDLVMSGIDSDMEMYKYVPKDRIPSLLGYLFTYAGKKSEYAAGEPATGVYSREAFDENGQMTWVRDYAMSDYKDHVDTYGHVTVDDASGNVSIADDCVKYLKDFKKYVESKGASIYFVSPPVLYESLSCSTDDFLKLRNLEEKVVGIPYISDPQSYMMPEILMSNSVYHPNSYGELMRTQQLADDLKRYGVVKPSDMTKELGQETGETLALTDTLPKRMLHIPHKVSKVYRFDSEGKEIVYKENVDYTVDYKEGVIRRTQDSAIPNYINHKVTYVNGKFSWNNDPDNYNPEDNSKYQIYVDYSYRLQNDALRPIDNQSEYLSDKVKNKLLNGEDVKIALCGDSIGAGAGVSEDHCFLSYLADTLHSIYGSDISTYQASVGGMSRGLLKDSMNAILAEKPDVMMIEFGTNDHAGGTGSDEELASYHDDLASAIDTFQKNGIDVILIGFPQQNFTWDKENIEVTKKYNQTLRSLANEKNIYFADVYDIFYRVGLKKNIFEDVDNDFIHHPTEWGHKLYLTSLMPVFNIKGDLCPNDIRNYVYIDQ